MDDEHKAWEWQRDAEGNGTWTQYWPNGKKKSESTWHDGRCTGQAQSWLPSGQIAHTYEFREGMLVH
jgi:antitoxin component YwqK of YwqJK toxin-antitoxin module